MFIRQSVATIRRRIQRQIENLREVVLLNDEASDSIGREVMSLQSQIMDLDAEAYEAEVLAANFEATLAQ